jgi:prepilin-type processing-associated H-X9-DG protein
MKRTGLPVIALFAVCALCAQTANKYDIKSGIVTLESVSTVAGTQIKMSKIIYFDDYGMKECQETYSNGKLTNVLFCDGKDKIALQLKAKKAQKQGPAYRGIGMRVEINDMGTKKDIESGMVKKLPPMTIDSQSCEVIQVTRGNSVDLYAGWHQVMVYMKTSSAGVSTEIKAVKLQANAVVPKEKFQVPAGFTVQ